MLQISIDLLTLVVLLLIVERMEATKDGVVEYLRKRDKQKDMQQSFRNRHGR